MADWTKESSKLSIKELKEKKDYYLVMIKANEEMLSRLQGQSSSPSSRREMEMGQSEIERYKKMLALCEATLEKKALSSIKNRDSFSLSTKVECVSCDTLSGTMSGFSGSGKSHTLALLTGEPPPWLRVSTAITEIPSRRITQTRLGVNGSAFVAISDDQFTDKVLVSAKECVSRLRPSTTTIKMMRTVRKLLPRRSEPTHSVERDLMVKYYSLDDSVESLEGQTIIEISDCGGQPQFLEILPRFLENNDFCILVTNLSQSFDDHPINYYYNQEGKPVGVGEPSPLTNEQVIRLSLRMIASQCQGGRKVMLIFVGTHRDLEGMCIHKDKKGECKHKAGGCCESREVKNQRLKEIVESLGLQENIIDNNFHELIFAVNAKTPEAVDHQTIDHLRQCILRRCTPRTISIPVSYHAVDLTLKRKTRESGHIAFCESAILKEVPNCHFNEETIKHALRYLHRNRHIFYFEREFPGRIIGEPQVVLNKQTELVVYSIQLSTNPEMKKKLDREQWRFVEYGLLTVGTLEKFPNHYVEGIFLPADMMQLLVKLLIVSRMSGGEYLMPCVLPTDPLADCNPEPDTQSVPPMVLHFPGGPARYGVFCGTICHVMTKSKWKLLMEGNKPYHITRNSVHFCVPGYLGKVTLNDPFDSFFVVTVHVPGNVSPYHETVFHLCAKVRDTLLEAITTVTKKLNYSPGTPNVAFLCSEHEDLHPATRAEIGNEMICTKLSNCQGGTLTNGHKVWLGEQNPGLIPPQPIGPPSYDAKPLFHQLEFLKVGDKCQRIIEEVGVDWEQLAYRLQFDHNVVEVIKSDNHWRNKTSCQDILRRWLDGGACQPVTWRRLVEAIRDIPRGTLATQIQELLKQS